MMTMLSTSKVRFVEVLKFLVVAGFPHNPYNGVMCNDTITATGVFSSKELWKFSKGG